MSELLESKKAKTENSVAEFIRARFSPRVFDEKLLSDAEMNTLFEAASWAASSSNMQPWIYLYGHRGSEIFNTILSALNPSNQIWAKDAAVLCLSMVRGKTAEDKPGRFGLYDLGMANATLMLQAQTMSIFGRMMAGFQQDLMRQSLNIPANYELGVVTALGYLGSLDGHDEQFVERERKARERHSHMTFAYNHNPFKQQSDNLS